MNITNSVIFGQIRTNYRKIATQRATSVYKITFILKTTKADIAHIILLYTCSDGRLTYYTREKTLREDWPKKIGHGTAAVLDRIKRVVRELEVDYKIKGDPLTRLALKNSLDVVLHKKDAIPVINFFEPAEAIIDRMEIGEILTKDKKQYSASSIKTFRFTLRFLEKFDSEMKASSITMETYSRFIQYCQELKYSTNYIGAQIKNWKMLGKHIGGKIFEDGRFKKIQEETFDVYLDEKELTKIFNLKLNSREALVRDWFILDCYTGLRVSDLLLLTKKNFSNGFITIANEKTDEKVVIPAHPFVKKIIEKYGGFPPRVTDVEINRTIKKVAEQAKINDEVLFTITKGGKRQDEYLQKWQMVSSHTSRRSFITNLRKNGVADTIVMKLAGIKSANTLKRYDKLSVEEAAKIASKLKFFK